MPSQEKYSLDNTSFAPIFWLFKFGQECHIKDLQSKGYMYLKNLDYFVQEEKRTLEKGVGDIDEARSFEGQNVRMYLDGTDTLIATAKDAYVRNANDLSKPVFCMTGKNITEEVTELHGLNFISMLTFDEKFNDFGEFVLLINDKVEFLNRIKQQLDKMKISFSVGMVKYRDTSRLYIDEQQEIEVNTAFNKNPFFEYQSEFRILLDTCVDDHFSFEIGDIQDISTLLETELVLKGLTCKGTFKEPIVK